MKYYILSSHDTKEGPIAMFLKEERTGYALIYMRCAPNNVVRFRSSLMAAAGALITTKYGPISPPGPPVLDRFAISSQPAYCRRRTRQRLPSLTVLPPTDVSVLSYIDDVMGAAMEAAPGYRTRNLIFEYDKARPHGDL